MASSWGVSCRSTVTLGHTVTTLPTHTCARNMRISAHKSKRSVLGNGWSFLEMQTNRSELTEQCFVCNRFITNWTAPLQQQSIDDFIAAGVPHRSDSGGFFHSCYLGNMVPSRYNSTGRAYCCQQRDIALPIIAVVQYPVSQSNTVDLIHWSGCTRGVVCRVAASYDQ